VPVTASRERIENRQLFAVAFTWAALVVIVVHFMNFPGSVPNFRNASGGGTLLDAVPAFTPDGIYQRFADYGEDGRRNYRFRNITVDILLPLSVLPFLFLLNAGAARVVAGRRLLPVVLLALPVVYVGMDFVENATVLHLLGNYPNRLDTLAHTLPYTTVVKRLASLLSIAVPLAILGFDRLTRSRR
jgi:hypothetical protein